MLLLDPKTAKGVKATIKSESAIRRLGDFFKIMGDTTRLKIILALSQGELCVCDLATLIGVSPSAVSHQLRILRGARTVQYRRDGKIVYYSLDDHHIEHLLEDAQSHLRERP